MVCVIEVLVSGSLVKQNNEVELRHSRAKFFFEN